MKMKINKSIYEAIVGPELMNQVTD